MELGPTWDLEPGKKPGKKPGNKPGKNLVKTMYFPGQPGKPGNVQPLPGAEPGVASSALGGASH